MAESGPSDLRWDNVIFPIYRVFKKTSQKKNRYISRSNYGWKMFDISFESNLLKFFDGMPLFIVRYNLPSWQELTYHAQNWWCKKVGKVLNTTIGVINEIRRAIGSMLRSMVRSPSFSNPYKKTSENITPKPSIIMGHTTVVQKGSEHRLCQKTKGKRKEEHFGPVSVVPTSCSTASLHVSRSPG